MPHIVVVELNLRFVTDCSTQGQVKGCLGDAGNVGVVAMDEILPVHADVSVPMNVEPSPRCTHAVLLYVSSTFSALYPFLP